MLQLDLSLRRIFLSSVTATPELETVSEDRMSPRAECSPGHLALGHNVPPGHSTLVQIVPLSAECYPTLVMLDRAHKGAVERTG